jgi:citrate lyase subunit beta/citryl-CoA lyase
MEMSVRPRRSFLYMPGSNARALEKAKSLAADGLIFDLEDAVAPDAKEEARRLVMTAVTGGGYGRREVMIRINGLGTPWGFDDVWAAARSGADGILVPKTESADMLRQVEVILESAGAPADLDLWAMMETPRGILAAESIAQATPRLAGLIMGTSDLAKDLHAAHTRERLPMFHSLAHCLLVARAYGLAAIDGVHLDLGDDDGFAFSCRQGLEMGFDGKTLIHPKTIAVANQIFAPGEDELAWSHRIIAAHNDATEAGKGVVVVDGRLVENLHVVNARRIVALAEQIALMEGGI